MKRSPCTQPTGGLPLMAMPLILPAHLVSTGFGPFYDGLLHLLTSPSDLLPALALALLAGLQGRAASRRVVFLLPAALLVGAVLGLVLPTSVPVVQIGTVAFLVLGGLVAADVAVSARWMGLLAVGVGLVLGYANGSALSLAGYSLGAVLGMTAGVFVLVVLAAAGVTALRAPWGRIAVRVAGSWIAAVGLLMIGWSLRGLG
jgi:urease accessory protein